MLLCWLGTFVRWRSKMSKPPSSKNPSSTSKTGKTVSNKTTEALFTWVAGKNDTKDEKAS